MQASDVFFRFFFNLLGGRELIEFGSSTLTPALPTWSDRLFGF